MTQSSPDLDLCDRPSCLECPKLTLKKSEKYACNLFRAQYERKKASIEDARYSQALAQAEMKEAREF